MIPFESLSVVYSHSILAMALSCVISEIKRDTGRKSRFFIPHAFTRRPVRGGDPRRNIVIFRLVWKTRMMWRLSDGR